jgi:hypothetical protein
MYCRNCSCFLQMASTYSELSLKKLWGFSPPANYTDWATATCWRS